MPSEHARKCGHKGHNSRACDKASGGGFKLFGVEIDVGGGENGGRSSIRRSKSLGNLQACTHENPGASNRSGYQSDGLVHQSSKSLERKKGRPWSEEEHRLFLVGLEKLGKGDWKGIATNYVPTRNSSQVASHAQKYFIRKSATEKKRRRHSVFDIPLTDVNQPSRVTPVSQPDKAAESSKPATSWAASTNNIGEQKGLARTIPPLIASERPPLSPVRRHGNPEVHSMLFAPRVSGKSQGFSTQAIQPTIAWVPFVTFSNQNSVSLPNFHGTSAPTCAKFVGDKPSIAKLTHSTQRGTFQAGFVPLAANDELNLDIGKLTL